MHCGRAAPTTRCQGPNCRASFPPAESKGATVDVAISGTELDDATTLIFSHPGLSAMQKVATSQVDNVARPVPESIRGHDFRHRAAGNVRSSQPPVPQASRIHVRSSSAP